MYAYDNSSTIAHVSYIDLKSEENVLAKNYSLGLGDVSSCKVLATQSQGLIFKISDTL